MSFLPSTAASVRTLVVSWKLAADIKLSVFKLAFVIPRSTGCHVACSPPSSATALFSTSTVCISVSSPGKSFVSPDSSTLTFLDI